MLLITGATGFIGASLIRDLSQRTVPLRALLQPTKTSPSLPKNVPIEIAVASMSDERGLRAALKGIDTVIHLTTGEKAGIQSNFEHEDVEGTELLLKAAAEANVSRIFFLSHIGAEKSSAFGYLRAKAYIEEQIQASKLAHTILRTSLVFGPHDGFTEHFRNKLYRNPFFMIMPGDGNAFVQPLWIDDLLTCLRLCLHDDAYIGKTITIGGGEFFSLKTILQMIMQKVGFHRALIPLAPSYIRAMLLWLGESQRGFLPTSFWLDYFSADRSCRLDSLPHHFGILPARFNNNLDYLRSLK